MGTIKRAGFVLAFLLFAVPVSASSGLYVNGVELSTQQVSMLERRYGIRIADVRLSPQQIEAVRRVFGITVRNGRLWYDRISGAWGYEGLPAVGQVMPNLPIGGPLKPNASGGGSPVAVNGRILHPFEYRYLVQLFGSVIPGQYYLYADGSYGLVGGPVMGNINAAQRRGSGSSLSGRDKFGSVMGGDDFVGYLPPSSGGVGVTCAPDGGCIYD